MAGIYIHIPFCRKNCSYCDFYFSLNKKHEPAFFNALRTELALRKFEMQNEAVHTVYLGGGTPSYASIQEVERVLNWIYSELPVVPEPEVTLEANPDDLTREKLSEWKKSGINRLSVGVQSFSDKYLKLLNRSHNARQVHKGLENARKAGFENITVDLIYGIPGMTYDEWEAQINRFLSLSLPHLSAYALTVEKGTLLHRQVEKNIIRMPDDEQYENMFFMLVDALKKHNYEHYEISNWALAGRKSRHNRSYWSGEKYFGFGPSAHSYDGKRTRRWNVANLHKYIRGIREGNTWYETERLSDKDLFNELIMTRLRTSKGIPDGRLKTEFAEFYPAFIKTAELLMAERKLKFENGYWKVPESARFITDGIIETFFVV